MIDKKLREILKQLGCNSLCKTDGKWVCAYIKGCIYLEQRNKAISQIKSLVINSLGKEKTTTDIEPTIGTLSPINYGQNLHIAEMKKKWK